MIPTLDTNASMDHIQYPFRPGSEKLLAFYHHATGDIYCDPNQMVIPIDDHLVHRGDGVFETLAIIDHHILQLNEHIQRLVNSSKALSLSLPCSSSKLREYIISVAKAANTKEGNIRILIGRGTGGFSISPLECLESSLYIIVYKTTPPLEIWYKNGLTAYRSTIPSKPKILANIKTVSCIFGILMELEAIEQKVDLTLAFNKQGCLTETATANIALIAQNGTLILPEFQDILIGTTLEQAIEILKTSIPIEIGCITESDLLTAKEIFVLGTTYLCVGITQYNRYIIGNGKPGPISNMLRNILKKTLLAQGTPIN